MIDKSLKYIGKRLSKLSTNVVYAALLLIYAYKRKETPRWAKNIVLGALAYLLSPFDVIPDLTPFLGFTDDFGMIIAGLSSIALYINDEVKDKARKKLKTFFPNYDVTVIEEVEDQIS